MWNDFAYSSRNPHGAKLVSRSGARSPRIPTKYLPSTVSAGNGIPTMSSTGRRISPIVLRRETTTENTLPKRNMHETAAASSRKSRMPLKGVFDASVSTRAHVGTLDAFRKTTDTYRRSRDLSTLRRNPVPTIQSRRQRRNPKYESHLRPQGPSRH